MFGRICRAWALCAFSVTVDRLWFIVILSNAASLTAGSPNLLFASRDRVRCFDAGRPQKNLSVIADDLSDAAAVDFLFSDDMIFWTDIAEFKIFRLVINNTEMTSEPIVSDGLKSPDGLACDWIGRHLYWTDSETKRIEVSQIDGRNRKVLYWTNMDMPRSLALDPTNGYMYWTDWGEYPKIERAGMDGSAGTRSVIVDNNIRWPNGLTINYEESRIYWVDAKLGYIHSCGFLGEGREIVTEENIMHPFSITMYSETLYWTDWNTDSIESYNKVTGKRKVILNNLRSPMGIKAYMSSRQPQANNPCDMESSACSHLCLLAPTAPFYRCACPTGLKLLKDGKTCSDGPEALLLVARRTDLRRISLDTSDFTDIVIPVSNVSHGIAIDFDPVDDYVYWSDDDSVGIKRARLDGTDQETLISHGISHPDGIAVDWIGRNIYWTDTGTDRIEVARLGNPSARKVLISSGLDEPRAICLDPIRGYMFWTDWGEIPKIERASLDGTARIIIVDSGIKWPNGIACHIEEQKIFWGDAGTDKIEVASFDGTHRKMLIYGDIPHLFGLSLLGDYVYWTDWQMRTIQRADKTTGKKRLIILDQMPDLMGLKAVESVTNDTNGCSLNNGGCSYLCLFTPKGPNCACPDLQILDVNNKDCILPNEYFLLGTDDNVSKMTMDGKQWLSVTASGRLGGVYGVDFHLKDNMVYWIALKRQAIRRSFMDGFEIETIIQHGVSAVQDLAVDWLANNIYWTDSVLNRIEMARLNGSSRAIIVWKDLIHPASLLLDPPNGLMYWTSATKSGLKEYQLEKALLDGSQRSTIVTKMGMGIGLTIDYELGQLFWSNNVKRIIESATTSGKNRTTVIHHSITTVTALAQYEDRLYWAERKRNHTSTIKMAYKLSGKNKTILRRNVDSIVDMMVVHGTRQSGTNICAVNNGGCSDLCIALPPSNIKTHICTCPTQYVLHSDQITCSEPDSFLLAGQFRGINRLVVNATDLTETLNVVLPIPSLKYATAIEYDPWNKSIYWIDPRYRRINRAFIGGTQPAHAAVHNRGVRLFDFAVDPFSRTLFWSCVEPNTINFTRTDASGHLQAEGAVIVGGKSRHLAINPEKGEIFWTSLETPPSIRKSLYDGSNTVELVTGLGKPGPITVDLATEHLYCSDIERQVIEVLDLTGTNRRTLIRHDFIAEIVGVAVLHNYLYLANRREIRRTGKETGANLSLVVSDMHRLTDISASTEVNMTEMRSHPCVDNNGNCSHLCMAGATGHVRCACPKQMFLSGDQRTCVEKTNCQIDQFQCNSGDIVCIPKAWRCDGIAECSDGSDEQHCSLQCDATRYSEDFCKEGQCISEEHICNAHNVCVPVCYASILDNYCYADFVFQAKINNVLLHLNGDRLLDLRKKIIFFKGDRKTLRLFGNPYIPFDSACGCDAVTISDKGNILIMGETKLFRNYVTYIAKFSEDKIFRQALRRIKKGYDCMEYADGYNNTESCKNRDSELKLLL